MMNMRILQPSRKPLKVGDIFVLQMRDDEYIFGRVIRLDARVGVIEKQVLIYIYRAFSADKQQVPSLRYDQLLVPPIITTRHAWSKGYFETVEQHPLSPDDVMLTHCFKTIRDEYVDEYNNVLPERIDPCGFQASTTYLGVDILISEALGISRVNDD